MIPTRTNLGPTRWPGPEFIPRIGNWVTVRGSVLGEGPGSSVAVLIEEAQPPELAPLIADGYGLTDRKRRVTELVAQGLPTNDIGQ
jgi:hypothetical protein